MVVQAPERGFVPWNKETFLKVTTAPPEQLVSRFKVSHGMVLKVLSRERGGVDALRALFRDCHETDVNRLEDWRLVFEVDYEASHEREVPSLALVAFEAIS